MRANDRHKFFLVYNSALDAVPVSLFILILGSRALYHIVWPRCRHNNGYTPLQDNPSSCACSSDCNSASPSPVIGSSAVLKKSDNRLLLGAISCPLAIALASLHAVYLATAVRDHHHSPAALLASLAEATGWVLVALSTILSTIKLRSDHSCDYRPAWSLYTRGFYTLSFALTIFKGYWHWFAPGAESTPFLIGADWDTKWLLVTFVFSAALFALVVLCQNSPYYQVPLDSPFTPTESGVAYPEEKLAPSPEIGISWFDWCFFTWLVPTLRKGMTKPLGYHDLYSLPHCDKPTHNWRRFRRHKLPGRSLLHSLIFTFLPEISLQFALTLVLSLLVYCDPYFLRRTLQYIHDSSVRSTRAAFLDVFAMFSLSIIKVAIQQRVLWIGRKIGIHLKCILIGELSVKTLKRRGKSSDSSSGNDKNSTDSGASGKESGSVENGKGVSAAADGKVMNLMTSDFSRITEFAAYIDNIYEPLFRLVLGLIYLYWLLGIPSLFGASIMLVYYLISRRVIAYITKLESARNAASDERLSKITELIQGIRVVKLFGWESQFVKRITDLRETQLGYLWKAFKAWSTFSFYSSYGPMLVILVTFGLYTGVFGHQMTAELAFTSISIFQILSDAFDHFPIVLNWMIGSMVSLQRIASYLDQLEVQPLEERIIPADCSASVSGRPDSGLGFDNVTLIWETDNKEEDLGQQQQPSDNIHGADTLLPNTPTSSEFKDGDDKAPEAGDEGRPLLPPASAYNANNGNLSYESLSSTPPSGEDCGNHGPSKAAAKPFSLVNIDLGFPENGITIIAGPTGSGKTSLLLALVGEMTVVAGKLRKADFQSQHESPVGASAINLYTKIEPMGPSEEPVPKATTDKTEDEFNRERLENSEGAVSPVASTSQLGEEEIDTGYVKLEVWTTYLRALGGPGFWIYLLGSYAIVQTGMIFQDYWIRIWVSNIESSSSTADVNGSGDNTVVKAWFSGGPLSSWLREWQPGLAVARMFSHGVGYYAGSLSNLVATTSYPAAPSEPPMEREAAPQHGLQYWLGIYILIGVVYVTIRTVMFFYTYFASVRASRAIHARVLDRVVHATPKFFETTPIGRIVNRFSRDMQAIDEWNIDTIRWCISEALGVVGVLVVVSYVTPIFVFVAVAIAVVYVAVGAYYLTAVRELKRLESNTLSPLLSHFSEAILGTTTIRAFGKQDMYVDAAIKHIDTHNRPSYLIWGCNRWLGVWAEMSGSLVTFISALFIVSGIYELDAGMAGFALSYAMTLSFHMLFLVHMYVDTEVYMNSVERARQYFGLEQEAPSIIEGRRPPEDWPRSGHVVVKDLTIEYNPGEPVLHNLSFEVKPGEKVGVVGRTGAGKSTLSLAFLRFVEATGGSIVLDNIDISQIGLEDLRRKVTIIPQDPTLFDGTIRMNLDPFNDYSDEAIWEAMRRTYLVADKEERSEEQEPDGEEDRGAAAKLLGKQSVFTSLDAPIHDSGSNLSLGQRQLVALARALLRSSRVIIMDEATASVDFQTDRLIQTTIRGPEFKDSTLLCIAHRLRTIMDYDRVLVLDKGEIVEFDTPWNLLTKYGEDGLFYQLCQRSHEYDKLYEIAKAKHKSMGSD
ncbi:hypothetical protein EV182_001106 [Spiromyces aspiralis]|uniref:Uncharacterized protein n=1 Tax=Spiromyces aspiralis TaxID=68401 RepID=A0ACC1HUA3_9FUNG|nr:hypothetical protein EV182_001106 [Spiromyces aspiralis]